MGAAGGKSQQPLGFPRPVESTTATTSTPATASSTSSPFAATSGPPVVLPPFVDDRTWIVNPNHPSAEYEHARPQYRVMSYNVLAPAFYHGKPRYAYLDDETAQSWKYRFALFAREVKQYQPDIVCLQEIEPQIFTTDIEPFMKELGLVGKFEAKTPLGTLTAPDGCAMFWRHSAFKLLETHPIQLGPLATKHAPAATEVKDPEMKVFWSDLAFKDNVGQCAFLEIKAASPTKVVCVTNVHLFWNPSVPHIKTMQAMLLLDELHRLTADFTIRSLKGSSLILCGDFNSLPREVAAPKYGPAPKEGYASGCYELITTGTVGPLHPQHPLSASGTIDRLLREATKKRESVDSNRSASGSASSSGIVAVGTPNDSLPDPVALRRSTSGDGTGGGNEWVKYVHRVRDFDLAPMFRDRFPPLQSPFTRTSLTDPCALSSAYASAGAEPEFTNWTKDFKGTLDYIFYSVNDWHVQQVLQLPFASSFKLEALPDFDHPSDHLPIVATLMLL